MAWHFASCEQRTKKKEIRTYSITNFDIFDRTNEPAYIYIHKCISMIYFNIGNEFFFVCFACSKSNRSENTQMNSYSLVITLRVRVAILKRQNPIRIYVRCCFFFIFSVRIPSINFHIYILYTAHFASHRK